MEFIRIEGGLVVELLSCPESPGDGWVEVDLNGGIFVGADIRAYTDNWVLRPVQELLELGLVELERAGAGGAYPEGTVLQKVVGGTIVPKTPFDLIKEGAAQLGELEYLDDATETIKTAESIEEMLALGVITQEAAVTAKARTVRAHRDQLLGAVDVVVTNPLRWGSLADDEKAALAAYRQALLGVPQQSGFPWNVEWPESPV